MDDATAHSQAQPESQPEPTPLHVEPSPVVADALKRCQLYEDMLAANERDRAQGEASLANARRFLAQAEEVTHLLAALRQAAAGSDHVVVKTEPHPTAPGAQQMFLEDGSVAVLWLREPTSGGSSDLMV